MEVLKTLVYSFRVTKLSLPLADWLTLSEAADVIGITKGRLSIIAKAGKIPSTRLGRQVLILRSDAVTFKKKERKAGRPKSKRHRSRSSHPPFPLDRV